MMGHRDDAPTWAEYIAREHNRTQRNADKYFLFIAGATTGIVATILIIFLF